MNAIDLLRVYLNRHRRKTSTYLANEWLNGDDMSVYVRLTRRSLGGSQCVVLDIANIDVFKRGLGKFTRFLEEVEKINPWSGIYVENVLEDRFARFFVKRGYIQDRDLYPPSFYHLRV